MIIRNVIYAILLGVSMAACLSQQDEENTTQAEAATPELQGSDIDTDAIDLRSAPAAYAIAKGHVGNIKIGMPIEQLRNNVPAGLHITDTTLTQEGQQSTAYLLTPQGQHKGLLVEQDCQQECSIWRISVRSPTYKTASGMGVGSKYSEIQQAYKISSVSFEEGNVVAIAPEAGMSFIIDHSQLSQQQLARVNAKNLPANTLVKRVLVY
ncbi:mechanosensitive ion channel protein MscS [Pontibacter rugosus]|uniref:Mechanosensitive ion channel protein MscS n=1 Tax=Pontibacter rugosus TaxID=1745966 RepID=A0ABW3SM47_9BACT